MRKSNSVEAWAINVLATISQLLNVLLFNGHPNETISGRCYREDRKWAVAVIDAIFFFDPYHCMGSHLKDVRWANNFWLTHGQGK